VNRITVLFFATLKDRAGLRRTELDLPDGTHVRELRAILGERFPALVPALRSALVAINRDYAADDEIIPTGAEVALFPPVSGG
jgi:molybdopterin converting factor subunit 1